MGLFIEADEFDRRLDDEDHTVIAPACGHRELPGFIECGMCGDCADEAVDRAQERQIAAAEL